jgi:hypothetical protein
VILLRIRRLRPDCLDRATRALVGDGEVSIACSQGLRLVGAQVIELS